jgi:hypothetical protein
VSEPPLSPLEADLVDAYLRRNGEVEQRAEEDGGAAGILRELLEGGPTRSPPTRLPSGRSSLAAAGCFTAAWPRSCSPNAAPARAGSR